MRVTDNNLNRCPKCIGGRLLIDNFCGEAYCINCGWRQAKRRHTSGNHSDASQPGQTSMPTLSQVEAGLPADSANATISLARLLKWLEDDES